MNLNNQVIQIEESLGIFAKMSIGMLLHNTDCNCGGKIETQKVRYFIGGRECIRKCNKCGTEITTQNGKMYTVVTDWLPLYVD